MSIRCLLVSIVLLGCTSQGTPPHPVRTSPGAANGKTGAGVAHDLGALTSSGVCGFTAPVTYGAPGPDGMVDVPPDDPSIFYMGRVDCDPSGPAFAFPAVSVRLRFHGTALDLRLSDGGTGTPTSTNYYDVSVDGAAPIRLEAAAGDHAYPLASGLADGEHTVEIVKRGESNGNTGKARLLGFRLPTGARLLPVRQRPRRLEFVGDSITTGYGNEVSTTQPDLFHFTTLHSNANAAYGAVAARRLDAEYVAVAVSGRGVYRNWTDAPGELAPEFYDDTLPDDAAAPAWDFTRYLPHVVVVNLGTNDFSPPGPDHDAFRAAYARFLERIRARYPDALLLAVVGPMLTDSYPPEVRAWSAIQSDVAAVVDELRARGDTRVHFLALTPQQAPYGEDYHPTVATHLRIAREVAAEIQRLLASPR